jgi:hypothetical protein
MGYSFGDEHLNEVIIEGLIANPSSVVFALQFGRLVQYPAALALAEKNFNLSLLGRDEAILRGNKSAWMVQPSTDSALLNGSFEINDEKDDAESEKPQPCEFLLGDFRAFGKFLDEFSIAGTFSGSGRAG